MRPLESRSRPPHQMIGPPALVPSDGSRRCLMCSCPTPGGTPATSHRSPRLNAPSPGAPDRASREHRRDRLRPRQQMGPHRRRRPDPARLADIRRRASQNAKNTRPPGKRRRARRWPRRRRRRRIQDSDLRRVRGLRQRPRAAAPNKTGNPSTAHANRPSDHSREVDTVDTSATILSSRANADAAADRPGADAGRERVGFQCPVHRRQPRQLVPRCPARGSRPRRRAADRRDVSSP